MCVRIARSKPALWATNTQSGSAAASMIAGGTGSPGSQICTGSSLRAQPAHQGSVLGWRVYRAAPTRRRSRHERVSTSRTTVLPVTAPPISDVEIVLAHPGAEIEFDGAHLQRIRRFQPRDRCGRVRWVMREPALGWIESLPRAVLVLTIVRVQLLRGTEHFDPTVTQEE